MSETFEVRIDSIAAGGDGVGRHNGVVVFVPRTSPGDVARVDAHKEGRLMRGRVLSLVTASPDRIQPRCPHYTADSCGGCQLQHIPYGRQLTAKAGVIRDALARIGRVSLAVPDIVPSPEEWRYRTKLSLALRSTANGWVAGLHRLSAPDQVFALEDCHIADEAVVDAWRSLRPHLAMLPKTRQLRLTVRALADGFTLAVEGGDAWTTHAGFFDANPRMLGLWWRPYDKGRRLLHSRSGRDARAAGASFTQVNPRMAERLSAYVVERARAHAPSTVVDAYAGTGDVAVALAEQGARVTAIEIDAEASQLCASRLPAGSKAVAASVESALPDALPADLVVLNPPRAGVTPAVTTLLQAQSSKPRAVLYVSCNPATLARDLKRLEGYRVASVLGFDMFPQTAHVETVCELVPAA